jgi:two-component system cell cycle response regulator
MALRVLLVESQPEDILFLRDVLTELDGGDYWSQWTSVTPLYAGSWSEASALLATEPVDVMLLDLDLEDSQGLATFHRSQIASSHVPVVVLIDGTGVPLAERALREGAQEFLMKDQVDCRPLARAISNAIARHRLLASVRSTSMVDSLTGLLNRTAFLLLAERDRVLAERLGRRMMMIAGEVKGLQNIVKSLGEHRRDLELVAASDYLRSMAGPADLTARIGESMLAMTIFDTEAQTVEEAWARLHGSTDRRIAFGSAVFDPEHPVTLYRLIEEAAGDILPKAMTSAR